MGGSGVSVEELAWGPQTPPQIYLVPNSHTRYSVLCGPHGLALILPRVFGGGKHLLGLSASLDPTHGHAQTHAPTHAHTGRHSTPRCDDQSLRSPMPSLQGKKLGQCPCPPVPVEAWAL